MMKLGFLSAIFPDLSLEEVIAFASSEKFDCVELACWPKGKAERRYAGVTHIDVVDIAKSDAERIKALLLSKNVEISDLVYCPNPLTPDKKEADFAIEHIKKLILASELLGVNQITSFIGRDRTKSVDDNWHRFKEVWKPLVKFAEDHGVRIAIENCPMLFSGDEWPGGKNLAYCPAIWRRMFEEIPGKNFGLNDDPSHLVWQQIDYLKPLREFSERIFHIHAKDVRIDREKLNEVGILATPLEYHSPKLPGLGEVNWSRFFSVLSDVGYTGPVCIEVEDRAYETSKETCKAAIKQSALFLRQFLANQE
jgi:sugar phosphate isomerase/epimerase